MNRSTQLSDESDFYQLETEPLPSLDIPVVQLYTALPALRRAKRNFRSVSLID